jgi:hypothetical protein
MRQEQEVWTDHFVGESRRKAWKASTDGFVSIKPGSLLRKRSEPYPRKYLGSQSKFVPIPGEKGKAFAKFEIPGKLTVFPRKDGKTKIHLNVSVRAKGRTESKWLLFELEPESKWKTESIFLPVEIVKSFRGNPREWDW